MKSATQMKEKRHRDSLVGLEGVKRKETKAIRVRSVTDALRWIRQGEPVTTAGDNGALTVWRDDAGALRCEFDRYCVAMSKTAHSTVAGVHRWLKEWWPKLGR